MYKKDILVLITLVLVIDAVSYNNNYIIDLKDRGYLLTFISIYFGFLMTSLLIMINSPDIKSLSKVKDYEDSYKTLLNRLSNYYKTCINFSLLTILTLFFILPNFTGKISTLIVLTTLTIALFPIKDIYKIILDVFNNKTIVS